MPTWGSMLHLLQPSWPSPPSDLGRQTVSQAIRLLWVFWSLPNKRKLRQMDSIALVVLFWKEEDYEGMSWDTSKDMYNQNKSSCKRQGLTSPSCQSKRLRIESTNGEKKRSLYEWLKLINQDALYVRQIVFHYPFCYTIQCWSLGRTVLNDFTWFFLFTFSLFLIPLWWILQRTSIWYCFIKVVKNCCIPPLLFSGDVKVYSPFDETLFAIFAYLTFCVFYGNLINFGQEMIIWSLLFDPCYSGKFAGFCFACKTLESGGCQVWSFFYVCVGLSLFGIDWFAWWVLSYIKKKVQAFLRERLHASWAFSGSHRFLGLQLDAAVIY